MVYGVLGLINFAHSDVYMFGAFMGYYIANSQSSGTNWGVRCVRLIVVMLAAMALSAVLGHAYRAFCLPARPHAELDSPWLSGWVFWALSSEIFFRIRQWV